MNIYTNLEIQCDSIHTKVAFLPQRQHSVRLKPGQSLILFYI